MIISHKHRFIFVKTRKTGGSSTEIALAHLCGPDDVITNLKELRTGDNPIAARNEKFPRSEWSLRARMRLWTGRPIPSRGTGFHQHMPATDIRRHVDPKVWQDYFKFTIERNPWDRQVSLYHWHYRDRAHRPSFSTFIKSPFSRKKSRNWSIYTENDRPIVDHVIMYDDLRAGLQPVLDRIGISEPVDLPKAKSGYREKDDYRSYYDDETRDIVGRWYEREIAEFGFTF